MPTITTGATVDSMPSDRPLMITVALPVSLEEAIFEVSAKSRVGL